MYVFVSKNDVSSKSYTRTLADGSDGCVIYDLSNNDMPEMVDVTKYESTIQIIFVYKDLEQKNKKKFEYEGIKVTKGINSDNILMITSKLQKDQVINQICLDLKISLEKYKRSFKPGIKSLQKEMNLCVISDLLQSSKVKRIINDAL